ncbi:uL15 family ribosomal protein [Candidatus Woesearchaeota archaeon]|nr:uL15 family ribosomal protein [Candidatus Woesearchaeota archaeon]
MKFKKRKVHKQRASTFHGWGRGKAHHKGAGNRGGRGRAGSGKRSDGKKPSFWKERQGKFGFTTKNRKIICAVNIDQIEKDLPLWLKHGIASKKGSDYEVDLTKAGFDKLLGTGSPSCALFIKVDFASAGAVEKIAEKGGEVTILKTMKKKAKKKAAPKKKADDPKKASEDESEE